MSSFDPVDWALAERVGRRVASRNSQDLPPADSGLPAQFQEHVAQSELLVAAETGLARSHDAPVAQVLSRPDWVTVNVASFRRLLSPLLDRWGSKVRRGGLGAGVALATSRTVAGTEVGLMLGWMSHRVLGQYDLLVSGDADEPVRSARADAGDVVYVVGPNLQVVERRFGFDPDQFRLWIALHECTHRAQFTGVEWLRPHFLALVGEALSAADPDPEALFGALRTAVTDRSTAKQRLRDGGAIALVASPSQRAAMDRIGGMMSLLEGHGDVVMGRAGRGLVPDAVRFAAVLSARRRQANPVSRLVQRLAGFEAKLNQYAAGERFIAAIESHGGTRAIDVCWSGPSALPSMDEIRAPHQWIERLAVPAVVTAGAA